MTLLDIRTVVFSQLITDAVCATVLALLWLQNRRRYGGMLFWVADFVFQTTAILLIVLRGRIPDWLSLGLSSPLVMAGALLGYLGLQRFLDKRSPQVRNYVLLVVFVLVHSYFVFGHSSLEARNLNLSLGLLFVCFQCAWLTLGSAGRGFNSMTRAVGWVFVFFCLFSLIRFFVILANPEPSNDFFQSGLYDTLILMSYQVLLILLTFGLTLMVNRRLLVEVRTQEEKFTKAFHSSPYAMVITRLSDGLILDVNRGFEVITGYAASDAIGKTSLDLRLWDKEADRRQVVAELSAGGEVLERELEFRTKSGGEVTGLFFAEILVVDDEKLILSSINDITERKRVQDELGRANDKLETTNGELQRSLAREETLARTDGLTGLRNRLSFSELAAREFRAAVRHRRALAVMMLDADNLKRINDTLGHAAGDKVLALFAQTATQHTRDTDVLARYGGDEFVLLLPETTAQQALPLAQRIRASLAEAPIGNAENPLAITLSIGIAELGPEPKDQSIENVVERADRALYTAKAEGRDRIVIFESEP